MLCPYCLKISPPLVVAMLTLPATFCPSEISACANSGKFLFHKDTCCDLAQMKAKIQAIPPGSNFKFYNANVETLQASIALGGHGFCGISGNFYPWLHVR
jgi:4-hydroxy-tetrahydrodipicolinate synthase